MDTHVIVQIIVLVLLLFLSAFFSASETAMLTANKLKMRALADDGDKKAEKVLSMSENQDRIISAILIGNNIVNLAASSLATTIALNLWGSKAVAVATGILTLVVLVFGEVTPKSLSARYADRIAMAVAGPIDLLAKLFTPIIKLINFLSRGVMRIIGVNPDKVKDTVTEEELIAMVEVSHEDGVIEHEEKEMITNVVDFGDSVARDIMVPRIDMVLISKDADIDELIDVFKKEKYTRIPVYDGSPDNVIGIINIKDLLLRLDDKEITVESCIRDVIYTYETKKLSELMREMKKKMSSIAIVLDEYGICAGMVTMEDMIEEIVGEIRDEYDYDETDNILKLGEKEYLIDGMTKPEELNERFSLDLNEEDHESVAGIVLEKLGHVPKAGEEISGEGYRMIVYQMDNRRIDKIKLFVL